jgi:hypothetical protein
MGNNLMGLPNLKAKVCQQNPVLKACLLRHS